MSNLSSFIKKVSLFLVAFFATILVVSAQIFVGGSISFSSTGGEYDYGTKTDKATTTTFSFAPKAGYYISDVLSAGLGFNLSTNSLESAPSGSPATTSTESTTRWGINLFARYTAYEAGKFSFLVQGGFGFGGQNGEFNPGGGADVVKHNPLSFFRIDVYPLVQYSLSDKFILESSFNLLGISFLSETVRNASNSEHYNRDTSFNFNVNRGFLFPQFNIGLIYKL